MGSRVLSCWIELTKATLLECEEMRRFLLVMTLFVVGAGALIGRPSSGRAAARTHVLVELFTSEGCSSCPAADALLQSFVDAQPIPGAEVIALGHHVDYWDQLGWKDRFSSGAATNRQQRYSQVLNVDSVYTPQMVVDGREELVGSDARRAQRAISTAADAPHAALTIAIEPAGADRVSIAVSVGELPKISRGDHGDVVVAVVESQLRSDVRGGENRGRALAHAPVVRQMTAMGEAGGGALVGEIAIGRDWRRDHLTIVAFVQERFSRHVLGAAAVPLQSARR
jgi:hypothetical protein